MRIDRDSYGTLALVFILGAFAIWASLRFIPLRFLAWALVVLVWAFCTWQLFFFRVPDRARRGSDKAITSSADGQVVIVDEAYEDEVLKRQCKRI